MNMNIFSTKKLPPNLRREYWNDAICEAFTGLVTDFMDDSHFQAELISTSLGDLTYAHVRTTRSKVSHTTHHASKSTEKVFLLHLQLANESMNSQRNREVLLKKGDFTLVDSESPYRVEFFNGRHAYSLRSPAGKNFQPRGDCWSQIFRQQKYQRVAVPDTARFLDSGESGEQRQH